MLLILFIMCAKIDNWFEIFDLSYYANLHFLHVIALKYSLNFGAIV